MMLLGMTEITDTNQRMYIIIAVRMKASREGGRDWENLPCNPGISTSEEGGTNKEGSQQTLFLEQL